MNTPGQLLARLDAIGASLEGRPSALALLGLGSVGRERERLDEYSDLDFFVVVREGAKKGYLARLDWLEEVHPIAWAFQNTKDGHKVLFADGIFCEYAVFEEGEIGEARHPGGGLVWQRPEFDPALCEPRHVPQPESRSVEWIVGEALSNLYVGMSRFLRGEKWTAALFVQNYAVARLAELVALEGKGGDEGRDPYSNDRRFEARFPGSEELLARCMLGYDGTPESALNVLEYLKMRAPVSKAMEAEIRRLIGVWVASRH